MGNSVPNKFQTIKSLKNTPDSYFVKGRYVRVINNLDYVRYIQMSYGGWSHEMEQCINVVCVVLKMDLDKTIEVVTPSERKWLFNRAALEPINQSEFLKLTQSSSRPPSIRHPSTLQTIQYDESISTSINSCSIVKPNQPEPKPDTHSHEPSKTFRVGEILRVSSDEKLIEQKQQLCGGYSRVRMRDLIGQLVTVKHFNLNCVRVQKNCKYYDLHPDIVCSVSANEIEEIASQEQALPQNDTDDKRINLFSAIVNGDVDKVFENVTEDILNIPNNMGQTPINLACCLGNIAIVDLLVEFGADVKITDNQGNLPIHNCALNGHTELLKQLLATFPSCLNLKTETGLSLLDISRQKKNIEMEKCLLQMNINTSSTGQSQTPTAQQLSPEFETILMPSVWTPTVQETVELSIPNENECTICRDGTMNVAFVKCGHVACRKCADRIFRCHICNAEIKDKLDIFL